MKQKNKKKQKNLTPELINKIILYMNLDQLQTTKEIRVYLIASKFIGYYYNNNNNNKKD